jgi:hypothetical protein
MVTHAHHKVMPTRWSDKYTLCYCMNTSKHIKQRHLSWELIHIATMTTANRNSQTPTCREGNTRWEPKAQSMWRLLIHVHCWMRNYEQKRCTIVSVISWLAHDMQKIVSFQIRVCVCDHCWPTIAPVILWTCRLFAHTGKVSCARQQHKCQHATVATYGWNVYYRDPYLFKLVYPSLFKYIYRERE